MCNLSKASLLEGKEPMAKSIAIPSLLEQLSPPVILDPHLFHALELVCRGAINYGQNHASVRTDVNRLAAELRRISMEKHGHDSLEVVTLVQLLDRTDPKKGHQRPPAELDIITALEMKRELSPQQSSAASLIRSVWTAFQRGRSIAPRSMEKLGGNKRARPTHPMDLMGRRVYEIWQRHYIPWFEKAKYRRVNRRTSGNVASVDIVFHILIEGHQPYQVDNAFRLDKGVAEKTLKFELDQFWDDARTATEERQHDDD